MIYRGIKSVLKKYKELLFNKIMSMLSNYEYNALDWVLVSTLVPNKAGVYSYTAEKESLFVLTQYWNGESDYGCSVGIFKDKDCTQPIDVSSYKGYGSSLNRCTIMAKCQLRTNDTVYYCFTGYNSVLRNPKVQIYTRLASPTM